MKITAIIIILFMLFSPIMAEADLKTLSDNEMGNVTAQAGFSPMLSFDEAFSKIGKITIKNNNAQLNFDDVFANNIAGLSSYDKNSRSVTFNDAFNSNNYVNIQDGKLTIARDVNLNFEMKNVGFDDVFTKVTGVNLGIGNALGIESNKMDVKVTGSLRVITTFESKR